MPRRRGRWPGAAVWLVVAFGAVASCNEIAGIDPVQPCTDDSDCATEPGCGSCTQGVCVLEPAGKSLVEQTPGDCRIRECDGRGAVDLNIADDTDVPANANPCLLAGCAAGNPTLTPISAEVAGCYDGPQENAGVGACHFGLQKCEDGELLGVCEGAVLPRPETCGKDQGDLDCDGKPLESAGGGDDCCGDGELGPTEACDDGNGNENDGCSSGCTVQEVLAITTGGNHNCALLTGGQVKCWGANSSGQLGIGDTINRGYLPTDMGDNLPTVSLGQGQSASAIAAGVAHSCALLAGAVKCWGKNEFGQLGAGVAEDFLGDEPDELGDLLQPVDLGRDGKVTQLAAGGNHACAILGDGSLKCWGNNDYGQLGIGSNAHRGTSAAGMGDALPAVDLGQGVDVVACGAYHTCAVLKDGSVKCWGRNEDGQLGVLLSQTINDQGDAPGEMTALPTVPLGQKATAISLGRYHTCALLEAGLVTCWGRNLDGELGQQSTTSTAAAMSLPAAPVSGGDQKVIAISAGGRIVSNAQMITYAHGCVVLEDLSAKCWGSNVIGQLGRGGNLKDLGGLGTDNKYGNALGEAIADLPPIPFGAGRKVTSIDVGGRHTCALLDDAGVRCWGENENGQLGQGVAASAHYSDGMGETIDKLPAVKLYGAP